MVLFVIAVTLSLSIAYFLGKKRQIGFGWSLFFSLCLSPIVGFIVTMLSPKYYQEEPSPSPGKKVIGWILIIFFSFTTSMTLIGVMIGTMPADRINSASIGIGLVGAGIYLIGRSEGRSYNSSSAIQRVD